MIKHGILSVVNEICVNNEDEYEVDFIVLSQEGKFRCTFFNLKSNLFRKHVLPQMCFLICVCIC